MGRRKPKDDKLVDKQESTTSMLTRTSKSQQQIEITNAVFNNPLLMDKIVKCSVYSSNGKQLNKKAIVSLRLVNKSWLQSTSRILKKFGDHIIQIVIGCQYEVNTINGETYDNKGGNVLDQIVSVFSKTSRSTDSTLPIYLTIQQLYLVKENQTNLANFLEQCSDLICGLMVFYPLDGGLMSLKCNNWNFRILRALKFRFETWRDAITYESKDPTSQSHANGLELLQAILKNSNNLQGLTLINDEEACVKTASVCLPASIKQIELVGTLTDNEVTLLTKNPLPNVTVLNLDISMQHEINQMYKILEHFRTQLTILFVSVLSVDDDESRICIKLPLMEKLKWLKLSGEDYTLFPELRRGWTKLIPNLIKLEIQDLPVPLFLDWVQGSLFENVTTLNFSLTRIHQDCQLIVSPKEEILREILTSFPVIRILTLKINLEEMTGLTFLFRNFPLLIKLHLDFDTDNSNSSTGCKVVSFFLGISLELASAIVDKSEMNPNVPIDNPGSIMNLKKLSSLTLSTSKFYCPGRSRNPLCSDVVLKYGLERMPNLRKIKLLGGFEIEQ